ncbi:MAG: hypothetical protein IPG57_07845 [Burkholderiales bacterium]|nr:hypothetical protein [Burkholderiales bacterium]
MPLLADIPPVRRDGVQLFRVDVEVQQQSVLLQDQRREVLQALECRVELQLLALHIVAQRHHVAFQRVDQIAELGGQQRQPFRIGPIPACHLGGGHRFRCGGWLGGFCGLAQGRLGCARGVGVRELQEQQFFAKSPVADQLDVPVDLLHRVTIVFGEVGGDAHQPRRGPVDGISGRFAQFLHHQQLELGLVVHQPVQVEQALVDDVFTHGALVLQDDGAVVLVQAQRVDAARVRLAGGVFGGQEADAQQGVEVGLDQVLQRLFQVGGIALQFSGDAGLEAEEFDVAHGRSQRRRRSSGGAPRSSSRSHGSF